MFKSIGELWDRLRGKKGGESLRETIEELIQETPEESDSSLNEEEKTLLSNVLALRDLTVEDAMVPRAEIISVEDTITREEFTKIMAQHPFTRVPVFHQNLDDLKGFVHVKDIALLSAKKKFDLSKVVQPVLFVPPSMRLIDLLLQMRATLIPMAFVVDEYGGVDGLVTAWDIVREILGDLQEDHTPEVSAMIAKSKDGSYQVDARLEIEEFEKEIGPLLTDEEREEDIDTIGGLVLYLAGRMPDRREVFAHDSGAEFEILEATPRRIHRVRVKLPKRELHAKST